MGFIAFCIVLLGFVGLGWSMYRRRYNTDSAAIIAFGMYAMAFGFGTFVFTSEAIQWFEMGPNGVKVMLKQLDEKAKEFRNLGSEMDEKAKEIRNLGSEMEELRKKLAQQTEESREAISKIENRLKPRRLTGKARSDFVKRLRASGTYTIVDIGASTSEAESLNFALEIRNAMRDAGWTVGGDLLTTFGTPVVGASIGISSEESRQTPQLVALKKALEDIGVHPVIFELGPDRLIIGTREPGR